mmetsp:Transcript_10874/g.30022  ORF Transcript_10874/g.30022 Transcript_10874/m.30022 type:complete len:243 (-) Transcript_10874:256-984(-)
MPSGNTSRKNNSANAKVSMHQIFDEGAFRYVYKGNYTSGPRAGEECVAKKFKTGSVYEAHYFDTDIKTVDKAINIIEKWNQKSFIDKMVMVNTPGVWELTDGEEAGAKLLVEPFIENYEKFNSNSGWNETGIAWGRAMQALSHFSYHITGGQCLLCDLQGGSYSNGIVLTDPVIISRTQGAYGPTDLGRTGISSFFSSHRCNEYCRRAWSMPTDRTRYHEQNQGTSMIHVPTQYSRFPMSRR